MGLQVEIHPFFSQEPLVAFAKERGLQVTAYSPLGSGAEINGMTILQHPTLQELAAKYNKSTAQLVAAWLVNRGIVVIPKSVKEERIKENFDVFFEVSAEDMEAIGGINGNARAGWGGPLIKDEQGEHPRDNKHPEYPFAFPAPGVED